MTAINKPITKIIPRKNGAAVDKVAASIKEFGLKVPIILAKTLQEAHFSGSMTRLSQSFHQLVERMVELRNAFFLKLQSHRVDVYAEPKQ